ncbi:MAG TPA: sugar phosphate nucleotidyltransferase [Candidatus Acidoferrum sp.]
MKAMVLAAGLGTRLRPLTDTRPKALVEVAGRTLLEITLARLHSFGINEVIVNVHHFADMVIAYLKSHNNFGMRIEISREDDLLLDTGGGLKKASWFFLEDSCRVSASQPTANKTKSAIPSLPLPVDSARTSAPSRGFRAMNPAKASTHPKSDQMSEALSDFGEPFLLHNVDVITNIDFRRMLQFHNEHHALATLAVRSRASSRLLLFNENLQLVGRAAPGATATEQNVIPGGSGNPGSLSIEPSSAPTQETLSSPPALAHPELSRDASPLPRVLRGPSPLALAFSGIHFISPRLLPMLTEQGPFSIIDAYLRLAAEGEKILAFDANEYYWRDLGRPADLSQAARDLRQGML